MHKKHLVSLLMAFGCALFGVASVSCSGGGGDDETKGTSYLAASKELNPEKFLNGSQVVYMELLGSEETRRYKGLRIQCDPAPSESMTTTADVTITFPGYEGTHEADVEIVMKGEVPILKLAFKEFTHGGSAAGTAVLEALGLSMVSDLGDPNLALVMAWSMSSSVASPDASNASSAKTYEDSYQGPVFHWHDSQGFDPDVSMTAAEWMGRYMSGSFVTSTVNNPAPQP